MYVHGRDQYYRPLIIFHPRVLEAAKIANPDEFSIETVMLAGGFLLEHVKRTMFIPGKVENWVLIVNQ